MIMSRVLPGDSVGIGFTRMRSGVQEFRVPCQFWQANRFRDLPTYSEFLVHGAQHRASSGFEFQVWKSPRKRYHAQEAISGESGPGQLLDPPTPALSAWKQNISLLFN